MNLLSRLRRDRSTFPALGGMDEYLAALTYQGLPLNVVSGGMQGSRPVKVDHNFQGYVSGVYLRSGPVASCIAARAHPLSQLRFRWRNYGDTASGEMAPGHDRLFGTEALAPLEGPGRSRMLMLAEVQASLAGNVYFHRFDRRGEVRILQPDWVEILLASDLTPDNPAWALDARVIGYLYYPGGRGNGEVRILRPDEVGHWAPEPDPANPWRGTSWVTAVLREIVTDGQATDHLSKFYENAATPQVIFTVDTAATPEQVSAVSKAVREHYAGTENAYRNIVVGGGTDVQVVGSLLSQLSYRETQGGHETRIASRSRVPPTIALMSEGMQGSALNSGNYAQTRRMFADDFFVPHAEGLCGALQSLVDAPSGPVELTFDPKRVLLLQEDRKDEAEVQQAQAATMRQLFDAGYTPESIVDAVTAGDLTRLKHTGLPSVQVQNAIEAGAPGADEASDTGGSGGADERPASETGTGGDASPRALAEMIQKIYLGVGKVVSEAEARDILNRAGAGLTGAFKAQTAAPRPALPPGEPEEDAP